MKSTIWVMRKVFRFCFKYIIGLIFIFLLSSFITIAVNLLNKTVVNELALNTLQQELSIYFVMLLISYLVIWLLSRFLGYLEAFANNLFRLKVDVFMQKVFMKKITDTNQESFFDTEFMEKYTFVCNNTNKASSFIFKVFTILFSNFTVISSSVMIFATYEPLLILYVLLVLFLQSIQTIITSNMQYKLAKKQIKEERVANYLSSLFVNKSTAKEMRIFKFSDIIYSKWNDNNKKYIKERIKIDDKNNLYKVITGTIGLLTRFAALLLLLSNIKNAKYDIGTFVMLFGLSETCATKISSLANNIFSGVFEEAKYFKDYYDLVFPISNKEITASLKSSEDKSSNLCLGELQQLEVQAVTFSYPNSEKLAINDVTFSINKGEIVSILGYNGSGKTTLSKVLCGAYTPIKGCVKINGKSISNYPKKEIFKYFGFAPQEYSKFSISIRDNVGLGRIEKMNDEYELISAYNKAELQSWINKYTKKDATIIGKEYDSEGIDISGGEMQRIILSSAYMGNPELLILDEPTASIDPLQEIKMLHNFKKNLAGKTAILISHRIGFARLADKIIIMHNGKIIEQGTHKDLLNNNGYYAEMFNQQKDLYIQKEKTYR